MKNLKQKIRRTLAGLAIAGGFYCMGTFAANPDLNDWSPNLVKQIQTTYQKTKDHKIYAKKMDELEKLVDTDKNGKLDLIELQEMFKALGAEYRIGIGTGDERYSSLYATVLSNPPTSDNLDKAITEYQKKDYDRYLQSTKLWEVK